MMIEINYVLIEGRCFELDCLTHVKSLILSTAEDGW